MTLGCTAGVEEGGGRRPDRDLLCGPLGRVEPALAAHHPALHLHRHRDPPPCPRPLFPHQDPHPHETGRRQDGQAGEAHPAHRGLCHALHHPRLHYYWYVLKCTCLDVGNVSAIFFIHEFSPSKSFQNNNHRMVSVL